MTTDFANPPPVVVPMVIGSRWDRMVDKLKGLIYAALVLALAVILFLAWQAHDDAAGAKRAASAAADSAQIIIADQATIKAKDAQIVHLLQAHSVTFEAQRVFEKDAVALAAELVACAKAGSGSKACTSLPTISIPTVAP